MNYEEKKKLTKQVGSEVRKIRIKNNLSINDVEKLTGIISATIAKYENGEELVSHKYLKELKKIAGEGKTIGKICRKISKIKQSPRIYRNDDNEVSQYFLNFRENSGLSYKKLGKLIGYSINSIWKVETGRVIPSRDYLDFFESAFITPETQKEFDRIRSIVREKNDEKDIAIYLDKVIYRYPEKLEFAIKYLTKHKEK